MESQQRIEAMRKIAKGWYRILMDSNLIKDKLEGDCVRAEIINAVAVGLTPSEMDVALHIAERKAKIDSNKFTSSVGEKGL